MVLTKKVLQREQFLFASTDCVVTVIFILTAFWDGNFFNEVTICFRLRRIPERIWAVKSSNVSTSRIPKQGLE